MIGTRILLHKNAFPEHSSEADQFVAVTITEMRDDVPGIWESRKKHRGYKAEGDDGLNYYLNWASYLDGIPTPEWLWFQENTKDCWYDIAKPTYFRFPFKPKFLEDYDFLNYCTTHQTLFYRNSDCWSCRQEKKRVEDTWKGWK